jgi:Zn-dependent M16 (insulinase) family peptidase
MPTRCLGSEISSLAVSSLRTGGSHCHQIEVHTHSRLSVIVAKMLQELPFEKRQGSSIARAWANKLTYDVGKATSEACALLHSLEFVPAVAEALEKDPESVISKMNEMRQHRGSIVQDLRGVG